MWSMANRDYSHCTASGRENFPMAHRSSCRWADAGLGLAPPCFSLWPGCQPRSVVLRMGPAVLPRAGPAAPPLRACRGMVPAARQQVAHVPGSTTCCLHPSVAAAHALASFILQPPRAAPWCCMQGLKHLEELNDRAWSSLPERSPFPSRRHFMNYTLTVKTFGRTPAAALCCGCTRTSTAGRRR